MTFVIGQRPVVISAVKMDRFFSDTSFLFTTIMKLHIKIAISGVYECLCCHITTIAKIIRRAIPSPFYGRLIFISHARGIDIVHFITASILSQSSYWIH